MDKTIPQKIKQSIQRFLHARKGVKINHNVAVNNCLFGKQCVIEPYCRINGIPKIKIGNNFYLNSFSSLQGDIIIGNDVLIGPHTTIWSREITITHAFQLIKMDILTSR